MNEDRPKNATMAGSIITGFSALYLMSGLGGLLAHSITGAGPAQGRTEPVRWMFEHFAELAVIQVVVASLTLVCGIGVLKRRQWARRPSQCIMFALAVFMIGCGVWMTSWLPANSGS